MDELIQILVIVISFIVFIISTVRKQRKKGAPVTQSSNQNELAELFGIPLNNEEDFVEEHVFEDGEKSTVINKEKRESESKEINKIETDNKQVNRYIDDIEDDTTEFDLRSAVIYSEILNRKTF